MTNAPRRVLIEIRDDGKSLSMNAEFSDHPEVARVAAEAANLLLDAFSAARETVPETEKGGVS
jgi:hypothetical protein